MLLNDASLRAAETFSSSPMSPTSAQPIFDSERPAPLMTAASNPWYSARRSEKPSYTPGIARIFGACSSARKVVVRFFMGSTSRLVRAVGPGLLVDIVCNLPYDSVYDTSSLSPRGPAAAKPRPRPRRTQPRRGAQKEEACFEPLQR